MMNCQRRGMASIVIGGWALITDQYSEQTMYTFRYLAAALLLTFLSNAAQAAEPVAPPAAATPAPATGPFTVYRAVLLQPDALYRERVANADMLAAYIRTVQKVVKEQVEKSSEQPPSTGFIVVALRPGQRSNAWLDVEPALPAELGQELIAAVRGILPLRVNKGPVVFALKVGLWGGKETARTLPNPAEWKVVEQQNMLPLETGELVEKVWKD
jgi:hypothetical protein